VRELRNTIERAVIFCQIAQITPDDLQFHQSIIPSPTPSSPPATSLDVTHLSDVTLATVEKALIAEALRRSGGNLSQAARHLGISREMIRTRMRNYKLQVKQD